MSSIVYSSERESTSFSSKRMRNFLKFLLKCVSAVNLDVERICLRDEQVELLGDGVASNYNFDIRNRVEDEENGWVQESIEAVLFFFFWWLIKTLICDLNNCQGKTSLYFNVLKEKEREGNIVGLLTWALVGPHKFSQVHLLALKFSKCAVKECGWSYKVNC